MLGTGNLEFGEIEIRHGILISILDTNISSSFCSIIDSIKFVSKLRQES